VRRNLSTQDRYSPPKADSYAVARRRRSRRNSHFNVDDWVLVEHLVLLDWSPEQVSGWLRLHGLLSISHETIYLRVWRDKRAGGDLWRHMRQATKRRRNAIAPTTPAEDSQVRGTYPSARPKPRPDR
jgi:IS30 family transposase